MSNGTWIVVSTKTMCGYPSRNTYARPDTKIEADKAASEALQEGHSDIEVYFHQYDEPEFCPAYGSFSEALEYDYSQN